MTLKRESRSPNNTKKTQKCDESVMMIYPCDSDEYAFNGSILAKMKICKLSFDLGNGVKVTKTNSTLEIDQKIYLCKFSGNQAYG